MCPILLLKKNKISTLFLYQMLRIVKHLNRHLNLKDLHQENERSFQCLDYLKHSWETLVLTNNFSIPFPKTFNRNSWWLLWHNKEPVSIGVETMATTHSLISLKIFRVKTPYFYNPWIPIQELKFYWMQLLRC